MLYFNSTLGRETASTDHGPSDKWFRAFLARHPVLSERTAENLDKGRARMSSQKTMDGWFRLLESVLDEHGLRNKEAQVTNLRLCNLNIAITQYLEQQINK